MAMVQLRKEDELTNENEAEELPTNEKSDDEKESSSKNSTKRNSPVFMPQYQYSKDELIKLSRLPMSQARPECLNQSHNNSTGKWDPEFWFADKRSGDKPPPVEDTRLKRVRPEVEAPLSHKRRTSDPRERVKEEKDEIILSPQRRSFGTGCQVTQHTFTKRPGSPADLRDSDNFRERRIGSGRIVNRDRDQRDWDRDHRDYCYGGGRNDRRDRFDHDDNDKDTRRYSGRYGRDRRMRGHERIEEEEPEWFSGGPTSQSETIELVGFEDASNDTESRRTNRKGLKKGREAARRQSLKANDETKGGPATVPENKATTKGNPVVAPTDKQQQPVKKSSSPVVTLENGADEKKSANTNFDMGELFRMDWMPEFLQNESSHNEAERAEIGGSRFSQWFNRDSPVPENRKSGPDEPAIITNSPTPNCSESYFEPISPALRVSPGCTIMPPHSANEGNSKNLLEMLQVGGGNNATSNGNNFRVTSNEMPVNARNIKEMEADLKRLVLGNNQPQQEDISAFDKLLQNMQDSSTSSISMGPLDKSKVLQEEDLLQNLLGNVSAPMHTRQNEKMAPLTSNMVNHIEQQSQNEMYNKLFEQQRQFDMRQQAKQMHQQQLLQSQLSNKPAANAQTLPHGLDLLVKLLDGQSHSQLSPVPHGMHSSNAVPFVRNDAQALNAMLEQCCKQRQNMVSQQMLKQQQHQQQRTVNQQSLLHANKDLLMTPQTLGLPTLTGGPSPMPSPLPPDVHGSALHAQGRVPSPLVFGQQPPALSHAPAPIHPNHLAQAMSQSSSNANTLQVNQNPMVLQRVPSPQELAVHTQTILQNALIKRKLEEQKENFRKRQEANSRTSPSVGRSVNSASPLKGISPTMAFTPTSVMRKMQSEKVDNPTKVEAMQNGASNIALGVDKRSMDMLQSKPNHVPVSMSNFDNFMNSTNMHQQVRNGAVARPVYGQCSINPPRPQHSVTASCSMSSTSSQGRPIVKGGSHSAAAAEVARASQVFNKPVMPNKMFPTANNQFADQDTSAQALNKFLEQQRLMQQKQIPMMGHRRQNNSPMQSVHAAASNFNFPPRVVHPTNQTANLVRPVNAVNFPMFKSMMQNTPVVRAGQSLNQLGHHHIAAMQMQRAVTDNRQIMSSQGRSFPSLAFQQILLNSQNPTAAQSQGTGGIAGPHGDGKHTHLLPGQGSGNRQSPVNLTKWFGNDVLKQKMPEMPPVSHQKALLLEDVERQQQPSAAVHN